MLIEINVHSVLMERYFKPLTTILNMNDERP